MSEWLRVVAEDQLVLDTPFPVRLHDTPVCLLRLADGIFAINDVCTHEYALLSDGYFEAGKLECPLHQACFDIRTGKALNEPADTDVATYPVKIEDGAVFVQLP